MRLARRTALAAAGPAAATPVRQPELAELSERLGTRALLELFALDGSLHALVLVDGRVRYRQLCAVDRATNELAALRFAIRRRLAYAQDREAAGRAARSIDYAAGELDRMLPGALAD